MSQFFYVYVLRSVKDSNFYTGYTGNLRQRIKSHQDGRISSTRNRLPMNLIYWEGCLSQADATKREKYLKSSWGKRYLKNRLANYLEGNHDRQNHSPL
jgi:putative endonuclease